MFGYDTIEVEELRKRLQLEIDKYNLPVILLQQDIDGDEISFSLENYTNVSPQSQEPINAKELVDLIVDYKIKGQISNSNGSPIIKKTQKKHTHDTLVKVLQTYNLPNNILLASKMFDTLERSSLMEEIRQSIYLIVKEKEQ